MIQPKRTISNGAKIKSPAKNNTGNGNAGNCIAASDSASKNIAGKRDDIRCWYLRNNSHHVSKLLAPYIYEMGLVEEDFGKNDIQANFTRQNSINKNGLDDECVGYNVGNSNNKICNMTTNNMNLNNVNASCNINQSGNPVNKLVLHSTVQKMFPVTIGTTSNNVRKTNDTIMISNGGPCLECYCNDDPVVPRLNPKRFDNEDEYPNHLGCLDSVEDVTKDGGGNNIGNPDWNGGQNIEIRNLNGDYADGRMERPIVTNRCYQCGDFNTQQQQHTQQQPQMGGYCQNPCCANYVSFNKYTDTEEIPVKLGKDGNLDYSVYSNHKCLNKFTLRENYFVEPTKCLICDTPYVENVVQSHYLSNFERGEESHGPSFSKTIGKNVKKIFSSKKKIQGSKFRSMKNLNTKKKSPLFSLQKSVQKLFNYIDTSVFNH